MCLHRSSRFSVCRSSALRSSIMKFILISTFYTYAVAVPRPSGQSMRKTGQGRGAEGSRCLARTAIILFPDTPFALIDLYGKDNSKFYDIFHALIYTSMAPHHSRSDGPRLLAGRCPSAGYPQYSLRYIHHKYSGPHRIEPLRSSRSSRPSSSPSSLRYSSLV